MTHAPAPWKLSKSERVIYAGSITITQHCGPSAASCSVDKMIGEMIQSNGNLIASAPDMLEALRNIVKHQDSIGGELAKMSSTRRIAAEAIKKATGEEV